VVEEQLNSLIAQWDGTLINRYTHLANAAAYLYSITETINWLGFYLIDEENNRLVLGPFQGSSACIEIPMGKGVCGTAAVKKESIRVADVHHFEGHIVCDSVSESELVLPLFDSHGEVVGVLDIDSPIKNRFTEEDQKNFEGYAAIISSALWT